jgi:hypothetical protein
VIKTDILRDYLANPDSIVPEFGSIEDLVDLYLANPGFHESFTDFMVEWLEQDGSVECEF